MTTPVERLGLDALRGMTALNCCLYPISQLADQLNDIEAEDPTLKPELLAAREHLRDAGEAIQRAAEFLKARFDVEATKATT